MPEMTIAVGTAETTLMYAEAAESAAVVARQLRANASRIETLGNTLRASPPRAVVTCARGSSDHAATYARYLVETHAHVLTSSASPSISSVYGIEQDLHDCLFLAISQSGRSPDLLASVEAARRDGAFVVALCNAPDAPLVPWPISRFPCTRVSNAAWPQRSRTSPPFPPSPISSPHGRRMRSFAQQHRRYRRPSPRPGDSTGRRRFPCWSKRNTST